MNFLDYVAFNRIYLYTDGKNLYLNRKEDRSGSLLTEIEQLIQKSEIEQLIHSSLEDTDKLQISDYFTEKQHGNGTSQI